jgi:hypothetical protein
MTESTTVADVETNKVESYFGKMTWAIYGLQPVTYNCWAEVVTSASGEVRMTIRYKEYGVWRSYTGGGKTVVFLRAEKGYAGSATLNVLPDGSYDGTWIDQDREGTMKIKFTAQGPQYRLALLR